MRYQRPLLIAALLLLGACTQQPVRNIPVVTGSGTPTPPPAGTEIIGPLPPDSITSEAPTAPARPPQPARQLADGSQLPAVKGLVASADRALAKGEVDLAAVNLERAQRLAPQSALVYQKLARVRLKQSRPAEAEQLARKALAYATGPVQQAELWRLIAGARRQRGQQAAAQEAEAKAVALETGTAGG
jgi:tetratricopeptide (TPR) repeat protein